MMTPIYERDTPPDGLLPLGDDITTLHYFVLVKPFDGRHAHFSYHGHAACDDFHVFLFHAE